MNSPLNFQRILRYLEREQAAVLIGPEACVLAGKPLHQALEQHLLGLHADRIAYHYRQEGLFLFEDKIAKNDAAQDVGFFFEEQQPEGTLFRQLAEMKFPLYVSLNPDTYLSDTFYTYGLRHRFNYFRRQAVDGAADKESFKEVEPPTQDAPLIYNLFGNKNDDESLILDYEDVFQLIASSTNPEGLPDKLRAALSKIRLFIFVGFQFDRWYTQLMLRLLCGPDANAKYATNQQAVSPDTQDFLVHQFQIEFLDPGEHFLDQLYAQCQAANLLRPLADPLGDAEVAIVRFVQNGEIDRALEKLKALDSQAAILLMARFSHWRESKEKGTLDSRDLLVEYNKIVDAILETLKAVSL